MPYAILRFQKKTSGKVSAAYAHNERKKEAYKSNPDIDLAKKADNYHIVQPKQTYFREVNRMIAAAGCRKKKNSVVMVETMITASHEFMKALPPPEQREYFQRAFAFVESKIGQQNIIAATVHMDEKTPHMHLSFCPITPDKRLCAKDLLGNQKNLSDWQSVFHNCMSERWPEFERGISSLITKRKHIPLSLYKQAERLDKQRGEIESAIRDIGVVGNAKKRDAAIKVLQEWFPRAEYFTGQVKQTDGYIKDLEQKERETQKRAREAEVRGEQRGEQSANVDLARLQAELADIKRWLKEERERSGQLHRQCRAQESFISQVPYEIRDKIRERMQKKPREQERGR